MKKINEQQTKQIIGGSLSGAVFSGIASIITAVSDLIGGIGSIAYAFSHDDHVKANYKFSAHSGISYDDSAEFKNKFLVPDVVAEQIDLIPENHQNNIHDFV